MPLIYIAQSQAQAGIDLTSNSMLGIQFSATSYRNAAVLPLKVIPITDVILYNPNKISTPINTQAYSPLNNLLLTTPPSLPISGKAYAVDPAVLEAARTVINMPLSSSLADSKGHTVTQVGTGVSVDTTNGYAVFTGVAGTYLQVASATDLVFGAATDFTVELNYRQTANRFSYPRLFNFSNTWNTSSSWALMSSHSTYGVNYLSFVPYAFNGNTAPLLKSPSAVPLNTDTKVAIQRKGSLWSMLINDAVVATATWAGALDAVSSNPLRIGGLAYTDNNDYFTGRIWGFKVLKYAKY